MRFWRKLVASGVLGAVLLLPVASVALCSPKSVGKVHCPDCPMTGQMSPHHQAMAMKAQSSSPCCTVQNRNPTPVTEFKLVPSAVSVQPSSGSTRLVVPREDQRFTHNEESPPRLSNALARLCTLLI